MLLGHLLWPRRREKNYVQGRAPFQVVVSTLIQGNCMGLTFVLLDSDNNNCYHHLMI